jgi:hypothetical protein
MGFEADGLSNRKERLFVVLLLLLLLVSERVVTRYTSFLSDDTPGVGVAIPKGRTSSVKTRKVKDHKNRKKP